MVIKPLAALNHLLSSKEKAYCPSWERKKNASRLRLSDVVRLKNMKNPIQITPRRTMDSTSVERSAKTKTICKYDDHYRQPKRRLGRLTVAADLVLESNAINWGTVVAKMGEVIASDA